MTLTSADDEIRKTTPLTSGALLKANLLVQIPYISSTNANERLSSKNMKIFRDVFSDKINLK